MPAGRYKHLLRIETNSPTLDGARQPVDNWSFWIERRGSIKPVSARERVQQDVGSDVLISHTIRVRFDSKTCLIDETMRVVFRPNRRRPARIFHIESAIDPDERRREIEMRVTERSVER